MAPPISVVAFRCGNWALWALWALGRVEEGQTLRGTDVLQKARVLPHLNTMRASSDVGFKKKMVVHGD